jgi:hypothetical protein
MSVSLTHVVVATNGDLGCGEPPWLPAGLILLGRRRMLRVWAKSSDL